MGARFAGTFLVFRGMSPRKEDGDTPRGRGASPIGVRPTLASSPGHVVRPSLRHAVALLVQKRGIDFTMRFVVREQLGPNPLRRPNDAALRARSVR